MSKKFNLFVGKAGQLYVMSEFLMRGWNVAMPEVDTGDDIFVVEDENDTFFRIQVKTAQAIDRQNGYSVQFNIPLYQLEEYNTAIYYVFLIRRKNQWSDIILMPQLKLYDMIHIDKIGALSGNNIVLYCSIQNNKITCSKTDFTPYLNNFNDFPIIEH
ncbi:MAG: hypothetical protein JNL70_16400 [Saprospiraceae bacterium]|nr:hypothetical protein [Saprospiraceae bacterium]